MLAYLRESFKILSEMQCLLTPSKSKSGGSGDCQSTWGSSHLLTRSPRLLSRTPSLCTRWSPRRNTLHPSSQWVSEVARHLATLHCAELGRWFKMSRAGAHIRDFRMGGGVGSGDCLGTQPKPSLSACSHL
jgi:hypothetical protein